MFNFVNLLKKIIFEVSIIDYRNLINVKNLLKNLLLRFKKKW